MKQIYLIKNQSSTQTYCLNVLLSSCPLLEVNPLKLSPCYERANYFLKIFVIYFFLSIKFANGQSYLFTAVLESVLF